ncbi:MAG: histidine--tRNA ligase [Promethearchaeota archaeon]
MTGMKRKDTELAVGGFRDFYPELYGKIDIILKVFRQVPKLFGYVEYECPTVEPIKLYQMKSGSALIEETFNVTDRKDRRLVLRPETTPSLARMLAAQQQFYPRPIRWFSVSRVFRDETQQRGRVKEFWQLNVDYLGIEDIAADAEVIDILANIILTLGFTPADFVIRINDRRLIQSFIESLGLKNYVEIIRVLDRRDKLLQEFLEERLRQQGYPTSKATNIALQLRRLAAGNQDAKAKLPRNKQVTELAKNLPAIIEEAIAGGLEEIGVPKETALKLTRFSSIRGTPANFLQSMDNLELESKTRQSLEPLRILASHLQDLGVDKCCEYDASIARGLDYYTGIVFEAWDRSTNIPRAIAGGGRYDDLVSVFKGQRLPGTGFGFGETVILQLAEDKGILPPPTPPASIYLAPVSKKQLSTCRQLATRLRRKGIRTIFNGFPWSLTKHLEDAGKRKIPLAAIVGPKELAKNSVNVRDLVTGSEKIVKIDKLAQFVLAHSRTTENRV